MAVLITAAMNGPSMLASRLAMAAKQSLSLGIFIAVCMGEIAVA